MSQRRYRIVELQLDSDKSSPKIQALVRISSWFSLSALVALKFSTQDIHRVIVSRIHTLHVYHALAIIK